MLSSIVVGTDGSESAKKAVTLAVDFARKFGAALHIVAAYNVRTGAVAVPLAGATAGDEGLRAALEADRSQAIVAEAAEPLGDLKVETYAEWGPPAEVVVNVATRVNADLIVVGSKGMHRRILGSIPNTVAHTAPCAVLIVKTV
jgi:nucleotide-binding universal stress UspA family protein